MSEKEVDNANTEQSTKEILEHGRTDPQVVPIKNSEQAEEQEAPPSPDLEAVLKESVANRDRWMRAVADLENYKKRALHEKSQILKYKNEDLLRDLLPLLDNLERALAHSSSENRSDPIAEGVGMVAGMFKGILDKYGVKEIKAVEQPFDPHYHEALVRMPMPDKPNNTVIQEHEKGYMYQDRLLRPSKVVVSTDADLG